MKLVDKLWRILGLVETEETDAQTEPEISKGKKERLLERKPEKNILQSSPRTQSIITASQDLSSGVHAAYAVMISHPNGFDDARQIADHLTHNRTVMVNFEKVDSETTKRTVDFMSGVTYAVGGGVQRISGNIFMFIPDRVDIVSTMHLDEGRGTLPWSRS